MKKIIYLLMTVLILASSAGCSLKPKKEKTMSIETSHIKNICELSVQQCYYHNVAKYYDKDAEGIWLWKKDRKFWIEYSGIAEIGIDASLVDIEVDGENVNITIPHSKVLSYKVDENSINEDSFIVDKNSADVEAEYQVEAIAAAQENMKETIKNDRLLLSNADEKVKKLLEDYINNVGECTNVDYTIKWNYIDDDNDITNDSSTDDNPSEIQTTDDDNN